MNSKPISVHLIVPNKVNPNKMGKDAFETLKLSIKKFGLFYPILVRKIEGDKFEILDGEWRWRAYRDLGEQNIPATELEATDEDLVKIIFATTIKGKHDGSDARPMVETLSKSEDSGSLKAMNLHKKRLDKKVRFIHLQHEVETDPELATKKGFGLSKEDSSSAAGKLTKKYEYYTSEIENFPIVMSLVLSKEEYDFITTLVEVEKVAKESFSKTLVRVLREKNEGL